ncbi:MAG: peptidyl-prolyl cis-trans isomerase [Cardiobacteriaceae bacterium]|nr:peptidyl-prolyl cis-trans isomerase [Cardiobacteriaceae bacterium]
MKKLFYLIAIFFSYLAFSAPTVEIKTTQGDILLELDAQKAPKTVENFLSYVEKEFYDGTIFHRVIKDFMIQGGGFDTKLTKKATEKPIENEANNGLKNERGTIAMARTQDPNSATSQFFINQKDNDFLDYSADNVGYAVFGKVVKGIEVVDKIAAVETGRTKGMKDVPKEAVIIQSIRVIKDAERNKE